jgi:hypothetical protein
MESKELNVFELPNPWPWYTISKEYCDFYSFHQGYYPRVEFFGYRLQAYYRTMLELIVARNQEPKSWEEHCVLHEIYKFAHKDFLKACEIHKEDPSNFDVKSPEELEAFNIALAKGYLKDSALFKDRIINNPFPSTPDIIIGKDCYQMNDTTMVMEMDCCPNCDEYEKLMEVLSKELEQFKK